MAEAAWRARLRQRVASAHDSVLAAYEQLQLAKAFLDMPIPPETAAQGPAAVRVKFDLAIESLAEATHHFNSAVAYMEAAEILALHGGNLSGPSTPLANIEHLELGVRAALYRLRASRMAASDACAYTGWCRGHLSLIRAMVDGIAIRDAVDVARREVHTVYSALTAAMQVAQTACGEVTLARQNLHP